MQANREFILDGFAGCHKDAAGGNKGVRLSLATLLLSYAVLSIDASGQLHQDAAGKVQLVSGLEDLLNELPAGEADAVHRALLALGTLVSGDKALVELAQDLGLGAVLGRFTSCGGTVTEAVQEVQRLLA